MRLAFALVPVVVLAACKSSTAPGSAGVALWVANLNANTVVGYSAKQITSSTSAVPAITLGTPSGAGGNPFGGNTAIAFDHNGNLWVAETGTSPTMLVMYAASQLLASANPKPAVSITSTPSDAFEAQPNDSSIGVPLAIAFDASGNLWVASAQGSHSSLLAFTPGQISTSGNVVPAIVIGSNGGSLDLPNALAFDRSGNLWVADETEIVEFSASQLASSGNPLPVVTFSQGSAINPFRPTQLAFDRTGNLWFTDLIASAIFEFAAHQLGTSGSPTPTVTITASGTASPVIYPLAIAFDPQGNLWVSSDTNAVSEFKANQITTSGSPSPAVTLSGSTMATPIALAFRQP
jgi:sugar lactone lactonase YvrE